MEICSSRHRRRPILYTLFFNLLITLRIFSTNITATAQIIPVKVGVVLDMDHYGQMAFNCISMALSDFYATHDNYKTRLVLINRAGNYSGKGVVVGAAAAGLYLIKNVEVQAIIGPLYSVQANFLISLGQKAQVPIITFSATSPSLSSLRSPYFVRATLNDSSQVGPIVAIVQALGWREVVPIHEDSEFGEGIIPFLTEALEQVNVRVPHTSVLPPLATDDQITAELHKLMSMQTRVFIVHMMSRLASRLFIIAKQLGMMSKDYAWIITDSITNDLNSLNDSVIESMQLGVIGVKPSIPKTTAFNDFIIRYNRTFNPTDQDYTPDVYALWAYDSATALAMSAETAGFLNNNNFKYQETNASRNTSTDLEAFGVSISGPTLVRALLHTSFHGLAGNFQLVDGQLQAPPYDIVNIVVGHGANTVGNWTKEKGISSMSNLSLESIVWSESRTSPPKGWAVPVEGKRLRVGVPLKAGFTEFVSVGLNLTDNSTIFGGECLKIFRDVIDSLPYDVPYDFVPFETPDHKAAGSYDDLVYQVYLGNYDAVAGDVTILANRSQYVDFTLPYMETGFSMVVPIQADKRRNTLLFVEPLTWQLWLTIFISTFIMGSLVYLLEDQKNGEFRGSHWLDQLCTILLFSVSTLFYAHKEKVVSNLTRIMLVAWFVVVFIITQSYSASLTSMLTIEKLQPTVTDVNVLIRNNDYVGYSNTSFIFGFLKKLFNESQLRQFNTLEEMDDLLSKGSANDGISAAFHEIPYIKLFLRNYCSKYTMAGPTYKAAGFGFVFPIDSPLVPDVSRAILKVTEGSKMLFNQTHNNDTQCLDPYNILPPAGLGLSSFKILYGVVGCVGLAAAVAYTILKWKNPVDKPNIIDPTLIETQISELPGLLTKFAQHALINKAFVEIQSRSYPSYP